MIALTGGDVVLPDRLAPDAAVVLRDGRILSADRPVPSEAIRVDVSGCYILPGLIDVHVHGLEGHDALEGDGAIARMAARLPRHGVTAFCPTTVACGVTALTEALDDAVRARGGALPDAARVLPAHLESNFISPDFAGAQPAGCLLLPPPIAGRAPSRDAQSSPTEAAAILQMILERRAEVAVVTLAPELPGALELIRTLTGKGIRVSLGHSGADFATALAGFEAGADRATHLFNRMSAMTHRAPGLAGAVMAHAGVAAEIICDGHHVHPAVVRVAVAAKGCDRLMAISDGTAASGLAVGARARLGTQAIIAGEHTALLESGTVAGSTATMAVVLRVLVNEVGVSLVDAARMCASTPAARLGLPDLGLIADGAAADLVVLDRSLAVVRTFIAGREAYRRSDGPDGLGEGS